MKKFLAFIPIFFPARAFAAIPDALRVIEVRGNFDIYASVFHRMALIMSDGRYVALFFSFVVFGILISVTVTAIRQITTENRLATHGIWLDTFFKIVVGMIIFAAFVNPKTDIVIRDETDNQTIQIADVPEGVVFVAGLMKKIENGLVRIIETSGSPEGHTYNPDGSVFNIYSKAFSHGPNMSAIGEDDRKYLNTNLRRYANDCLFMELGRLGTPLTIDRVNVNTDFVPIFEEAANPAIFTVYITAATPTGETCSCNESWARLSGDLLALTDTSNENQRYWNERCLRAGYNHNIVGASGPDMTRVCREKAVGFMRINRMLGSAVASSAQIMRQHLMAVALYEALQDADTDGATRIVGGRDMGLGLTGAGLLTAEWMPKIKGMIIGIFLGIMPFFMLLAATTMYRPVVAFIFGSFVFFTSWGLCDAIMHEFATDKAIDLMKEITNGGLGLRSFMLFESDAARAYACFGHYKMFALMFASIFSGVLTKMGGTMWTRAMTASGSRMAGAGENAAKETNDPVQNAGKKDMIVGAMGSQYMHTSGDIRDLVTSDKYKKSAELKTNTGMVSETGGGSVEAASDKMAGSNVTNAQSQIGRSEGVRAAAEAYFSGDVEGMMSDSARYSNSQIGSMLSHMKGGGTLDSTAEATGRVRGIKAEAESAVLRGAGELNFKKGEMGGIYINMARSAKLNAMDEIGSSGSLSEETRENLTSLASTPEGRAAMRSVGDLGTTIRNGREGGNWAEFLRNQGHDVRDSDLKPGSKVTMSSSVDEDGNINPGFLAISGGTTVNSQNWWKYEGHIGDDEAANLGLPGGGYYRMYANPGGDSVTFFSGQTGRSFTKHNTSVEYDTSRGYRVAYNDMETGRTGYAQISRGAEIKDGYNRTTSIHKPETFNDPDRGAITLQRGVISRKGSFGTVKGFTQTGQEVSFDYDFTRETISNYQSITPANITGDQSYRDLYSRDENGNPTGDNIRNYDLSNKHEAEQYIQKLGSFIENRYAEKNMTTASAGVSVRIGATLREIGIQMGVSGEMGIKKSNEVRVNSVSSVLHATVESAKDEDGRVDYEKAIKNLQSVTDAYMNIANKPSKPEPVKKHEIDMSNMPDWEPSA